LLYSVRIVLVFRPFGGIISDIFALSVQVIFVADNVFVVVALPYGNARGVAEPVDAFGHSGFTGADHGRDRTRW